jgi:hypothetical protein
MFTFAISSLPDLLLKFAIKILPFFLLTLSNRLFPQTAGDKFASLLTNIPISRPRVNQQPLLTSSPLHWKPMLWMNLNGVHIGFHCGDPSS